MAYMRLLPLLVFFLLAAAMALGLFNSKMEEMVTHQERLNYDFPALDLPMLGSEARFSNALWQGKPAVINFFASWCEPCIAEHAMIRRITAESGIPVFGVAWRDAPAKTQAWLERNGNPYQAVASDEFGKFTAHVGLKGIPETFVVDASGKVLYRLPAPLTEQEWQRNLLPLLRSLGGK